MRTIVKLALAVALGVMGFAAPAAADTIHVSNVALSYYEHLNIASFTVPGHTYAGNSSQASGQILLTTNIGPIGSWCVDLFHTIGGGPYDLSPIPLATDNSGNSNATSNALSATQKQQMQSLAAYGNANLPLQSTLALKNAFAAAIQAEIWIVEYGAITITGSPAFAAALSAIQTLLPTLPQSDGVQLANLNANGVDLFTVQHVEYPVPEPGTLALVGSILVALGLLRRRLRQPATTSIQ